MSEPDHRTTRILAVVQRIPPGHVATYGDVARLAGLPRRARLVGKVLREMPEVCAVPWHRVINATGRISDRRDPDSARRQQQLLITEGIEFAPSGRLDLNRYRWPSAATTPMEHSELKGEVRRSFPPSNAPPQCSSPASSTRDSNLVFNSGRSL